MTDVWQKEKDAQRDAVNAAKKMGAAKDAYIENLDNGNYLFRYYKAIDSYNAASQALRDATYARKQEEARLAFA